MNRKLIFTMFAVLVTLVFGVALFGNQDSEFITANLIGSVASGVGTTTNFNGFKSISQFLVFEISTVPQAIKVNVNGRVLIVDLDAAGITALRNPRVIAPPTNGYIIPISNGLQTEFTMDISVTNGVAAAFNLYAISKDAAPVDYPGFFTSLGVTVNQGSTQLFDNFKYLALPSMTASDNLNIVGKKKFADGRLAAGEWSSRMELEGARNLLGQYEGNSGNKIAFDNYSNEWSQLWFTPNATQKVYVQRLVDVNYRGAINI